MMDLRYATLQDIDGVYKLLCELESVEMPIYEFTSIYSNNLNNDKIHYLVVEESCEVIAFASLHIQQLLHHSKDVGEIQELIIKDGLRGKGIGSKLITKLKEISQENNCELIEVCCNKKRLDTHRFYEQSGFKQSHYKFTLWFGRE